MVLANKLDDRRRADCSNDDNDDVDDGGQLFVVGARSVGFCYHLKRVNVYLNI